MMEDIQSLLKVFRECFRKISKNSGGSVRIQQHHSKSVRNTAGILPEYFSHFCCCYTLSVPALDQVCLQHRACQASKTTYFPNSGGQQQGPKPGE